MPVATKRDGNILNLKKTAVKVVRQNKVIMETINEREKRGYKKIKIKENLQKYVCVCACVCERGRETGRQTETET
jgi:SpoU rRNA methylase family enzyme